MEGVYPISIFKYFHFLMCIEVSHLLIKVQVKRYTSHELNLMTA